MRAVKKFVCRIVSVLLRIVKCLIELRTVKEFVRRITKCLIELRAMRSLFKELYSV